MRFVILHYHLFKNAGSTIEDILDHSFGDRFGKLETPAGGGLIPNRDLVRHLDASPGLRAFSSHQIRHPLPQAPGYLFFDICFLRDPIDRLRSFYDYFRQRPNASDPMSDLANRYGLGDFVAAMIGDHSLFVRNNQVNLLACGGDSDEPDEHDLDLAIRRMRATSFLGMVDCFGQSVAAGAAALRRAFPELDCNRPPVNVSRGMNGTVSGRIAELQDACRPDVYEELLRITALDRQLVELARAEVMRRFEQVTAPTYATAAEPRGGAGRDPIPAPGIVTMARRLGGLAPYWLELAGGARATLFDADYYREATPDRGGSLLHFLLQGAWQGRQPHPLFDPAYYLRKYPDVAAAGVNPWCHYLKYGTAELRQPHPLFDPDFYLSRNPDVREAGLNPLLHYLRNGAAEDRKPHRYFDPKYYRFNCGKTIQPSRNPLVHFLESGVSAASPHPLFDCSAYVDSHPDVVEQGLNPLVHYLDPAGDVEPVSGAPDRAEPGSILEFDIRDIRLVVVCLDGAPDFAGKGYTALWQDDEGLTHWVAEPQQLPFLRAVSMDQIRAQTNASPEA